MKKMILIFSILASQLSFADEIVNTIAAIHNSAPGLTYRQIATGTGKYKNGDSAPCTLLYKAEGSKVFLTLIVKNKIAEITLNTSLSSYDDQEAEESMYVHHDKKLGQFTYMFDYGNQTNQYTGAHTHELKFAKQSENSFSISYYYGWADDDGWYGQEPYSCVLETEK